MAHPLLEVAQELRAEREQSDAISDASRETLPYMRRIADALGALRALVSDDTPTEQLESDLRVVQGVVSAIVGSGDKATHAIEQLPEIRRRLVTDVEAIYAKDPAAVSFGQIIACYPSFLAVATYRIANVFYRLGEPIVARAMSEDAHRQTGIDINLWGTSPLEVTHFKAGFLGIPPDFEEDKVYISDARKQLRYQKLRFQAMLKSRGYFNSSLWDTLSGEYYRSFMKKSDYFHIFDYWTWEEKLVDQTLAMYDWEKAPDTSTTWRIGDGTAALYNYIYYTVAGFTEHDTFRSNQIREGQLTREEALVRVRDENQPRYPNIKWYLDAIGMDFTEVVTVINSIPRLYKE